MAEASWTADDFQGLTPGVDPRRSDKFFSLNGQNYIFDSIGPRSVFGSRRLLAYPLGKPAHVQGFRLRLRPGDRVFTMAADSILEWREDLGAWAVLWTMPDTSQDPFRWTQAYLNGIQYFCHPATGILQYDLATGLMSQLLVPGVPGSPLAIVVNNGRLCAMDADFFYFSATSDGQDWTPRIGGAGFYRISDRISGYPIMLTSYTAGVMLWTTGGVMRAEFTGDQEVYRFRALNTEYRPINSFCTARIDDDTVVVLDERGLFQSNGQTPTAFSPIFNEFLIGYIQDYNLNIGQNIRLEWDELTRLMYVMVSFSQTSPLYEQAFVLYPPIDKWGQFNEPSYGILPFRITGSPRADDYYGYIDSDGRANLWSKIGSRETQPVDLTLNSRYPVIQKPTVPTVNAKTRTVSSSAQANTWPTASVVGLAGYYPSDGIALAPPNVTGLSASIQLGLLRLPQQQSADQLTEVTGMILGNIITGDNDRISASFNLAPIQPVEGFELEQSNFVNCKIRIISTLDGRSIFQDSIPQVTAIQKGARHYACSTVGIWHILELTASDVGEAFHLHSLDLSLAAAGKVA